MSLRTIGFRTHSAAAGGLVLAAGGGGRVERVGGELEEKKEGNDK